MSEPYFCSDLHFGHKRIGEFRSYLGITSEEDNRARIKQDWCQLVTKRDIVYVLGDACFTMETVVDFATLPGKKILIRGNHDLLDTQVYLKYFDDIYGILKYKGMWLSHPPIHPDELRNKVNLHGHVHNSTIPDSRYFNCCPENLIPLTGKSLISLTTLRNILKESSRE